MEKNKEFKFTFPEIANIVLTEIIIYDAYLNETPERQKEFQKFKKNYFSKTKTKTHVKLK